MNTINKIITRPLLTIAVLFLSLVGMAQDKSADVKVDITTDKGGNWYTQPWVWVVGAAVFILLLVALLRGGGREKAEA